MEKELIIKYWEYGEGERLESGDDELLKRAREAAKSAYAPYSKFSVGAALLLENGEYIVANNQENAAYPSGLCAERVALFYANSKFPDQAVLSLAVVAFNSEGIEVELPTYPCGACRQVMAESEKRGGVAMRIIAGGKRRVDIVEGISSLLPFTFDSIPER